MYVCVYICIASHIMFNNYSESLIIIASSRVFDCALLGFCLKIYMQSLVFNLTYFNDKYFWTIAHTSSFAIEVLVSLDFPLPRLPLDPLPPLEPLVLVDVKSSSVSLLSSVTLTLLVGKRDCLWTLELVYGKFSASRICNKKI